MALLADPIDAHLNLVGYRHNRFESFTETRGLYWFFRVPDQVVMVISCFRLQDGIKMHAARKYTPEETGDIELTPEKAADFENRIRLADSELAADREREPGVI